MDMRDTIEPKSDQMNAEDFLGGPGTFTIVEVRRGSGPDQPLSIFLAEFPRDRPFKPSKTVRRILMVGWGPETDDWHGRRFTLFRDPDVRFGGQDVGGIRVSHMSGIRRQISIALTATRGKRAPHIVDPLPDPAPAGGGPRQGGGPRPDLAELVVALNAAKIADSGRLGYCRNVVRRDIASAADLTPAEVRDVIASLAQLTAGNVAEDVARPGSPPAAAPAPATGSGDDASGYSTGDEVDPTDRPDWPGADTTEVADPPGSDPVR
jgi:hypothetical protein